MLTNIKPNNTLSYVLIDGHYFILTLKYDQDSKSQAVNT